MKSFNVVLLALSTSLFALTGCGDDDSPIEEAVEHVEETLNPQGPLEEAGEAADEAVENVEEAVDEATE